MNVQELSDIMLGDLPAKREKWYELLKDDVFKPTYNFATWDATREDPFEKFKKVRDAKMVSVTNFKDDPHNIFTAHEFLAMVDPSLAIKFTVQFNLFGGSIFALSTKRHEKYFKTIDTLETMGCFCLTELGYGNNAAEMETTVTYDASTKEFVVNCPSTLSQKYWISNGFKHANTSVVFG
jgi:acyl-CoA oxidase